MSRAGVLVQLGPDDGLDPRPLLDAMSHRGPMREHVVADGLRGWVVSHDEHGDGWDVHTAGGWTVLLHGRLLPPGPTSAAEVSALVGVDGAACLRSLLGPFAVVARHDASGTTILGRDCAGERPLFRTAGPRPLVASDQIALLVAPGIDRALDEVGVAQTLARYLELGPRTLWRAVHRVEPGIAVTIHADGREEATDLWPVVPDRPRQVDPVAFQQEYVDLLRRVVADSMPAAGRVVCDVSGGLDSSSVAVVLGEVLPDAEQRLIGLTTVFDDDPAADERAFAEAVLDRLPGERVVVRPTARRAAELVEEARLTADRPAPPNTVPPDVLRPLSAAGATRWYGGTGGDELFDAGLALLVDLVRHGRIGRAGRTAAAIARERGAGRSAPGPSAGRVLWAYGARPLLRAGVRRLGLGRRAASPSYVDRAWLARVGVRPPDPAVEAQAAIGGPAALVLDGLRSPYSTLTNEASEREASLVQLEVVSPFQDRRFWELSLSMPPELRLRGGDHRWLQRGLPGLPEEVAARRSKAEFSVQMAEGIAAYLDDPVALRAIAASGWVLDRDVQALRASALAGRWTQAWAIVAIDAWLRGLDSLP